MVTEQLEQMVLSQAHGAGHNNRTEMIDTIIKQNNMWFPRMQEKINEFLTRCSECMTRNIKSAPHAIRHFPSPKGPFTHLVMNFVDIITPIKGKRYMLVVVDRFSRWVEAFPVGKQSAEAVAQALSKEIILRFGVPSILHCDNGPGFVANVVKKMCEKLHITIKYGSVYHSQSQGRVERMNQTLKGKLSKICAQIGLNWVTALPIALMAIRGSTNHVTKLTPHEMVAGRRMPRGDREMIEIEEVDKLKSELDKYVTTLTKIHASIFQTESRPRETPDESNRSGQIAVGALVYIKVYRRK